MDDPAHTAQWLEETAYRLKDLDPKKSSGEIALMIYVLDNFKSWAREHYKEGLYIGEKALSARGHLLQIVGAEPMGHDLHQVWRFVLSDLSTLRAQKFQKI